MDDPRSKRKWKLRIEERVLLGLTFLLASDD